MDVLNDINLLREADRSDMLGLLESAPEMILSTFNAAAEQGVEPPNFDIYESIVIAGLGGSAICGNLIFDWLSPRTNKRIQVNRSYRLPNYIKKRDLLIVISYSGNTFETLMQADDAIARGLTIYAVTSGGKLEEKCIESGIPLLKVDKGMPPRYALPAIFGAIAYLICEGGLAEASEIEKTVEELRKLRDKIGFKASLEVNPSKKLAVNLMDRSISIYALDRLESVARRFKCQLNENSKMESRFDLIPELCHNEVEAWEKQKELDSRAVVLIRDPFENSVEKRLIEALKRLLNELGVAGLYEVSGEGASTLEAIWTAIYLLDYTSYYLAALRRVNPESIQSINRFKQILTEMD